MLVILRQGDRETRRREVEGTCNPLLFKIKIRTSVFSMEAGRGRGPPWQIQDSALPISSEGSVLLRVCVLTYVSGTRAKVDSS